MIVPASASFLRVAVAEEEERPSFLLNRHFTITALPDDHFLIRKKKYQTITNDEYVYSGYLVDLMQKLSRLANFTYELTIPSGLGVDCSPQIREETNTSAMYSDTYSTQYNCGVNDVVDLQRSDMYFGMYYLTPERQQTNYFTIPFQPPGNGKVALVGTATHIFSFEDVIEQQHQGLQPPVCVTGSTAMLAFLNASYPQLHIRPFYSPIDSIYAYMNNGTCTLFAMPLPIGQLFVQQMRARGTCKAHRNRPIGIVTTMNFGLSQYAIGVGKHVESSSTTTMTTAHALSYWINRLMIDGTLAELYTVPRTSGGECGYVAVPVRQPLLPRSATVGLSVGPGLLTACLLIGWYRYKLRQQERRYKKRFVQQIARNIQLGPHGPGSISPEKLTEQILHIGNGKDIINKHDLLRWLSDIKMDFISEEDFTALWNALDLHNTGFVNAVEFIVFLSACGPEFDCVYKEQESLPKMERLKLAARRLSTIAEVGELGVHQIEHRLDRMGAALRRRDYGYDPTESTISSHAEY